MQVVFFCTECRKKFSVSDDMAGKRIRCKECRHEMVIPAESDLEEVVEPWIVECDQCGRSHKPPDEYEGKRIKCKCGEVIHLVRGAAADLRVQQDLADPYEQGDLAGDLPGLPEMDDPWSAGSAYPPHTPQMPAYVPPQAPLAKNSPGQSPGAPAGANYAWTPPPAAQVSPPNFSGPQPSGPVSEITLERQRRLKKQREDKLLGRYDTEEEYRRPTLGGASDESMFGAGAIGGLALIVVGAVWLVVGLNFDILFYFPVVLIVAGVVSMIRSLL